MTGDWVKVNLNQRVRVTLTQEGQDKLLTYHKSSFRTREEATRVCDRLYSTWRTTGVIETQLWVLMGMFGESMDSPRMGGPFESNNIEIREGL